MAITKRSSIIICQLIVHVTVHNQYNDVNNQHDATTFFFIFLNQPNTFRETNSPILRSTFDCIYSFWYSALTLLPTGATVEMEVPSQPWHRSAAEAVPKAVYTIKKCSWGWANLSPETCWADLKILINEKVAAACWLFKLCICWFITQSNKRCEVQVPN